MKCALLVGINYYSTDSQLNGCINDVKKMKQLLLKQYGYKNENIIMLTDETTLKPTFQNIMNQLIVLLKKAKICSDIFFHYSGHGSYIRDTNGDEIDSRDECLVPLDYQQKGFITDDLIRQLFIQKLVHSCNATIIIDACHSGTCFDLPFKYNKEQEVWERMHNVIVPNSKIKMISGCTDLQTSSDAYINGEYKGAMTFSLTSVLEQCNFSITWKDLLNKMHLVLVQKNFSQKPELSSSQEFQVAEANVSF